MNAVQTICDVIKSYIVYHPPSPAFHCVTVHILQSQDETLGLVLMSRAHWWWVLCFNL